MNISSFLGWIIAFLWGYFIIHVNFIIKDDLIAEPSNGAAWGWIASFLFLFCIVAFLLFLLFFSVEMTLKKPIFSVPSWKFFKSIIYSIFFWSGLFFLCLPIIVVLIKLLFLL